GGARACRGRAAGGLARPGRTERRDRAARAARGRGRRAPPRRLGPAGRADGRSPGRTDGRPLRAELPRARRPGAVAAPGRSRRAATAVSPPRPALGAQPPPYPGGQLEPHYWDYAGLEVWDSMICDPDGILL